MSIYEIILNRRSIRKFKQKPIDKSLLEKLINAARSAPSGANLQPIKYKIIDKSKELENLFTLTKWAGYLAPEGTPSEGEKPVAYIIVLADTEIRSKGYELDAGAAVQNILLSAQEEGIGTCWLGSIDREGIRDEFKIPKKYIINTVVALGYPGEHSIAEDEDGSIKYYKDKKGVLHVPKRKLTDIIL